MILDVAAGVLIGGLICALLIGGFISTAVERDGDGIVLFIIGLAAALGLIGFVVYRHLYW